MYYPGMTHGGSDVERYVEMSEYRAPGTTAYCLHCKKPFILNAPNQLYCSSQHMIREQRKRRRLRAKGLEPAAVKLGSETTDHDMARYLKIHEEIKKERAAEQKDEAAAALKDVFGYVGPKAIIDVPKEDDTKLTEDEKLARANKGLEDI